MSRTAAKFTQADIARTIRAVTQCGAKLDVILEPSGVIRIVLSEERAKKLVDAEDKIRL